MRTKKEKSKLIRKRLKRSIHTRQGCRKGKIESRGGEKEGTGQNGAKKKKKNGRFVGKKKNQEGSSCKQWGGPEQDEEEALGQSTHTEKERSGNANADVRKNHKNKPEDQGKVGGSKLTRVKREEDQPRANFHRKEETIKGKKFQSVQQGGNWVCTQS